VRGVRTTCSLTIAVLAALGAAQSSACVGAGCLRIWSTADGGGALTVQWDPAKKIQTFQSFCAPDQSQCLYSTIDPGFMAPPVDDDPNDSYFVLKDNIAVRIVIVAADAALSVNVNGQKLHQPRETALLGTMPTIHNHPSWQIVVPGGQFGNFNISYRLTTDSPVYTASDVLTLVVTNVPPPEGTATPTPAATPTPTPCPGDCNHDMSVTIDELVLCVNIALNVASEQACPPCDVDGNGSVTVDEIIAAVNAALNGCSMTPPATLDAIQTSIFTPTCATQFCHDAQSHVNDLNLTAGMSYSQLVNVPSTVNASLLRVDPGHPENSFLLTKLTGPPPGEGSQMPLSGGPLTNQQIELIRNWILQGAQP